MKRIKKPLLLLLLVVSLLCNGLLYYCLFQERKPVPSIIKFGYSEHDVFVYCEKALDTENVKLVADENTFIIGNARLVNKPEALYLMSYDEKINLSDYEGFGFVINSDGELLYSLNTPVKKQ